MLPRICLWTGTRAQRVSGGSLAPPLRRAGSRCALLGEPLLWSASPVPLRARTLSSASAGIPPAPGWGDLKLLRGLLHPQPADSFAGGLRCPRAYLNLC